MGPSNVKRLNNKPIPPCPENFLSFPSRWRTSITEESRPPYLAGIPPLYKVTSLMASGLKTEKKTQHLIKDNWFHNFQGFEPYWSCSRPFRLPEVMVFECFPSLVWLLWLRSFLAARQPGDLALTFCGVKKIQSPMGKRLYGGSVGEQNTICWIFSIRFIICGFCGLLLA